VANRTIQNLQFAIGCVEGQAHCGKVRYTGKTIFADVSVYTRDQQPLERKRHPKDIVGDQKDSAWGSKLFKYSSKLDTKKRAAGVETEKERPFTSLASRCHDTHKFESAVNAEKVPSAKALIWFICKYLQHCWMETRKGDVTIQ
jgi:hypothetical protein